MNYQQYSDLSTNAQEHFNTDKEIQKYHLDVSTFDVINAHNFRNYKRSTIFWYVYTWLLVILSCAVLLTDVYTCVSLFLLNVGSEDDWPYNEFATSLVFFICIIFEFLLLIYHWIWAIRVLRKNNIALVYLNSIAKKWHSIRNYDHFCLFNNINEGKFSVWCCFLTYYELDNAFQILISDTPRQVINVLTLHFYATRDWEKVYMNEDDEEVKRQKIFTTLIVGILGLSVAIHSIFLYRFLFAMICYIPVKMKLKEEHFNSLKDYCCKIVNDDIETAVRFNHKPKEELLEQGILSEERIADLPILNEIIPNDNQHSKIFYRTAIQEYSSKESINPMQSFNDTTNSIQESGGFYGTKSEEYAYSPIIDQTNGLNQSLGISRDRYSSDDYTYRGLNTNTNKYEMVAQDDLSNIKTRS